MSYLAGEMSCVGCGMSDVGCRMSELVSDILCPALDALYPVWDV